MPEERPDISVAGQGTTTATAGGTTARRRGNLHVPRRTSGHHARPRRKTLSIKRAGRVQRERCAFLSIQRRHPRHLHRSVSHAKPGLHQASHLYEEADRRAIGVTVCFGARVSVLAVSLHARWSRIPSIKSYTPACRDTCGLANRFSSLPRLLLASLGGAQLRRHRSFTANCADAFYVDAVGPSVQLASYGDRDIRQSLWCGSASGKMEHDSTTVGIEQQRPKWRVINGERDDRAAADPPTRIGPMLCEVIKSDDQSHAAARDS